MATKPQSRLCIECLKTTQVTVKKTFLGFARFTCPACNKVNTHPLGNGTRIAYVVIGALLVVATIVVVAQGAIPIPGLLGLGAILGLVKDSEARKKLADAQSRAAAVPEPTGTA